MVLTHSLPVIGPQRSQCGQPLPAPLFCVLTCSSRATRDSQACFSNWSVKVLCFLSTSTCANSVLSQHGRSLPDFQHRAPSGAACLESLPSVSDRDGVSDCSLQQASLCPHSGVLQRCGYNTTVVSIVVMRPRGDTLCARGHATAQGWVGV